MGHLRAILGGFWSLLVGMQVTFKHLFRREVTLRYPQVRAEMPDAFRGPIALVRDPETGMHGCGACMSCVKACPSQCIAVEGRKFAGVKGKLPVLFEMDFALCSLCSLCVEACPTAALEHTKRYDDAGYRRDEWTHDLIAPYGALQAAVIAEGAADAERKAAARTAETADAEAAGPAGGRSSTP